MAKDSNQYLKDILRHAPQSWEDLAKVTKLLRVTYADFVYGASILIRQGHASQQDYDQFDHYSQLLNIIENVHFGARSASIEKKEGDFSDAAEVIDRISAAMQPGSLIAHFVQAGKDLVFADTVSIHGNRELGKSLEKDAVTKATDKLGQVFRSWGPNMAFLKPQIDTVLTIISDEIGVFPPAVRKTVSDILKPRLA
jgi:hypothetical protein